MNKRNTCWAVHIDRWKPLTGKAREQKVHCTLPKDHAGPHGWELDKAER
jgi:hypothetical protein